MRVNLYRNCRNESLAVKTETSTKSGKQGQIRQKKMSDWASKEQAGKGKGKREIRREKGKKKKRKREKKKENPTTFPRSGTGPGGRRPLCPSRCSMPLPTGGAAELRAGPGGALRGSGCRAAGLRGRLGTSSRSASGEHCC